MTKQHFKGCHPDDEQAPETPDHTVQETEPCWHCQTMTTVGACGCAECYGPGSEYVPASATYHCPLCGRWWAYMTGLNITSITLGASE